jgi:hypothetical protein
MLKAKLYAIACARFILWLFFSVLYVPMFLLYVVLQVAEWYIGEYERFRQESTHLLTQADEQLKRKG